MSILGNPLLLIVLVTILGIGMSFLHTLVRNIFFGMRQVYVWKTTSWVVLVVLSVVSLSLTMIESLKVGGVLKKRSFPAVDGKIISSKVVPEGWSSFIPVVEYAYIVAGTMMSKSEKMYSPSFGIKDTRKQTAERIVRKYVVGSCVSVHYNPDNPKDGFVDIAFSWDMFIRLGVGSLLWFGVAFAISDYLLLKYFIGNIFFRKS